MEFEMYNSTLVKKLKETISLYFDYWNCLFCYL